MSMDAPPLVRRWIDRLVQSDVAGLADLYDPRAELRAMRETWRGREEIEDGFTLARRWIRGIDVDVAGVRVEGPHLTFDTHVRGRIGHARIRHRWELDGGLITDHALFVLEYDKAAAVPALT